MTRKRSKNGLILTSFHSVCHSPTYTCKTLLANDTINGNRAVRVQKPSGMTRKRSKNGLILTSFHPVCHSPTKSCKGVEGEVDGMAPCTTKRLSSFGWYSGRIPGS